MFDWSDTVFFFTFLAVLHYWRLLAERRRHQKTATNTRTSPGLSHFGINCPQHLPLQTQLTVSRAWSQYLSWFQFSHHNHSYS
jgi:hypothetical protein